MEDIRTCFYLPEREKMHPDAIRLRDIYEMKPDAPIVMREFGFFTLEKWAREGKCTDIGAALRELGCDESGAAHIGNMGWCEAALIPAFEDKVLRTDGEYEYVQDYAGRTVKVFRGRRSGFMPTYVDHPVKDVKTFEENIAWRMDPKTPDRLRILKQTAEYAVREAEQGKITQFHIGGPYMYLRSLIGPEDLLYKFYDDPAVIHRCMEQWLLVNDASVEFYQKYVTAEELFFAEDICYKGGLLISPDMWREFIKPYYQQLIANVRRRNVDKNRHLYIQIDTDGDSRPAIPLYREIGMDIMSPFEVAAGCDVVEIGRQNPDLGMRGGFDKRIIAAGRDAIDREVDRILPVMRRRGGYIPTCDHGVPEEVEFEDWVYYRKKLLEYSR